MIKSKEVSDPNSCLNKAVHDEPIFVLKSTDEVAPHIVRVWASDYFLHKTTNGATMTEKQQAKYDEAMALARQMEYWKKAHP